MYENDILEGPEAEPENGTLADVVSPKGAYLGTGFISLKSKIRVRLISRNANDTFDAAFWRRRVEYAWSYRKTVLEPDDLSACRVIFGEADQLPRPDRGPFRQHPRHPDPERWDGKSSSPCSSRSWRKCCGPTARPSTASMSATTKPCAPKTGLEQNKGWL